MLSKKIDVLKTRIITDPVECDALMERHIGSRPYHIVFENVIIDKDNKVLSFQSRTRTEREMKERRGQTHRSECKEYCKGH